MAIISRELVSIWVIVCSICLMLGVLLDAASWASPGWGKASGPNYDMTVALWRICNTTRELVIEDGQPVTKTTANCVFPTELENQDWIPKALVMEVMAGFCALGIFLCLIFFAISLRWDWMKSRFVLVALIALAMLAGLFNFIGVLTIGTNMNRLGATPSYSIGLEVLSVISFTIACVTGVMDMQGCCLKRQPIAVKVPTRPI